MRRICTLIISLTFFCSVHAQHSAESILRSVESNGAALSAARSRMNASIKESKTGNTLPNPEAGYTHLWGTSGAAGQDEITLSQGFDFPTAYFQRSRIASLKSMTASLNYQTERMNTLLEAQLLILQINHLHDLLRTDSMRHADAVYVETLNAKRMAAGDISAIEENKISMHKLSAATAMERTRMALESACIRLSYLSGMEINPSLRIITPVTMEIPSLDSIKSIMKEKDPRLASARTAHMVSEKEKSLAASMALPKFSAGYKHSKADGLNFNGVMLGMSIPVWESRHTVSLARLRMEESLSEAVNTENDIMASLSALYQEAIATQKLLVSYHAGAFGQKNSALLRKALQWGEINILEYFVEIDTVYDNMEEYDRLMYDYAVLCACLNKYSL